MSTNLKSFFASYSRHDRAIVEPVVRLLRTTDVSVFFDHDSITPGNKWRQALAQSLDDATTLVLFWSVTASNSPWVAEEWAEALRQEKEIIPVLLDSTPLPDEIGQYQWIDWRPMLAWPESDIESEGVDDSWLISLAPICHAIWAAIRLLDPRRYWVSHDSEEATYESCEDADDIHPRPATHGPSPRSIVLDDELTELLAITLKSRLIAK